jgi:hypothetical protein
MGPETTKEVLDLHHSVADTPVGGVSTTRMPTARRCAGK